MLHGSGDAVLPASDLGHFAQNVEIDLRLRDGAVGERNAAVRRAGLHRDLADAGRAVEQPIQSVHVGAHFIGLRVVLADFADLAADGDRQSLRLVLADVLREVRGPFVIGALLLVARRKTEVDQRRSVDVDVVELGRQRFVDQRLQRLHLRVLRPSSVAHFFALAWK